MTFGKTYRLVEANTNCSPERKGASKCADSNRQWRKNDYKSSQLRPNGSCEGDWRVVGGISRSQKRSQNRAIQRPSRNKYQPPAPTAAAATAVSNSFSTFYSPDCFASPPSSINSSPLTTPAPTPPDSPPRLTRHRSNTAPDLNDHITNQIDSDLFPSLFSSDSDNRFSSSAASSPSSTPSSSVFSDHGRSLFPSSARSAMERLSVSSVSSAFSSPPRALPAAASVDSHSHLDELPAGPTLAANTWCARGGKLKEMATYFFSQAYGLQGVKRAEHADVIHHAKLVTGCSTRAIQEVLYGHSYDDQLALLREQVPLYPAKVRGRIRAQNLALLLSNLHLLPMGTFDGNVNAVNLSSVYVPMVMPPAGY